MRPEKKLFMYFIPRYSHFKIFALPSTPGSGTTYIFMGEGLKSWYFISLLAKELLFFMAKNISSNKLDTYNSLANSDIKYQDFKPSAIKIYTVPEPGVDGRGQNLHYVKNSFKDKITKILLYL